MPGSETSSRRFRSQRWRAPTGYDCGRPGSTAKNGGKRNRQWALAAQRDAIGRRDSSWLPSPRSNTAIRDGEERDDAGTRRLCDDCHTQPSGTNGGGGYERRRRRKAGTRDWHSGEWALGLLRPRVPRRNEQSPPVASRGPLPGRQTAETRSRARRQVHRGPRSRGGLR